MWEIMVMAVACAAIIFGIGFASINHAQKRAKGIASKHSDTAQDASRSIAVTSHPHSPMDMMTNSSGQQVGLSPQAYDEIKTGKTNRAALINNSR